MVNGIKNWYRGAMTLTIDKAGRLVLPKPIRDRLGLQDGGKLELLDTPNGILLRQTEDEPSLMKRNGRWVFRGQLPEGYDVLQAVREMHEERIGKIAG